MSDESPEKADDFDDWRNRERRAEVKRMNDAPHGVLLSIAYDGTEFSGWAAQEKMRTVADTVDGAIRALDPKASKARGTSRTDAGGHAEGQRAAFDTHLNIPPRGWLLALNQHLPEDVAIREATIVPPGYQPRFSSRGKTYRYRLLLDRVRDPFFRARAWRIGWPLDFAALAREATCLVGTHDFDAFRSAHDPRVDTIRTLTDVRIERESERVVALVVSGNAFLYNMVRILVGTLVDVARGHLPEGTVTRAIEGRQRKLAGATAPAHGLTLEHIDLVLPAQSGASWPTATTSGDGAP